MGPLENPYGELMTQYSVAVHHHPDQDSPGGASR